MSDQKLGQVVPVPADAPTEARYHVALEAVPAWRYELDQHQRLALGLA